MKGEDDMNEAMSDQTQMILAFGRLGMRVYEGTVSTAVKQKRRAANRVARRSRRINRLRG